MKMLTFVLWVVTPFGLLGKYQRFGETRRQNVAPKRQISVQVHTALQSGKFI
jgi:hypothetical protein